MIDEHMLRLKLQLSATQKNPPVDTTIKVRCRVCGAERTPSDMSALYKGERWHGYLLHAGANNMTVSSHAFVYKLVGNDKLFIACFRCRADRPIDAGVWPCCKVWQA